MLKIVAYRLPVAQRAHAGRNRPEVAAGTRVWAIISPGQNYRGTPGRYFHAAYLTREQAETVMANILRHVTPERPLETTVAFNFAASGPAYVAPPAK